MEGRLLVRPGAIALFADCRGGTGFHLVRELLESIGVQILIEEKHERANEHSLPHYALATARIYGICGCGPSGPAPKFAGADFANPPLMGTGPLTPLKALITLIQCHHPPQCFSDAMGRRLNLMEAA
jgi:hypothetical protein